MNLRITDGTTTINLNDRSTAIVTEYTPRLIEDPNGGVNETAEVVLLGTLTTIRSNLQSLDKLLRQADTYRKREVGARVYLEYQIADGEDYWRSEVLEAVPVPISETLNPGLYSGAMQIRLTWRRRPYWEGPETTLPLTNGNGTNVTTGLTVHPINDASHSNYVAISGANVSGDLPAPIKLIMENTYNNPNRVGDLWMALNVNSKPASFQHVLEGEDADYGAVTSGPNSDVYSGDYYGTITVPVSEGLICYWDLDNTFLQNCAGNEFMVLGKFFPSPAGDIWMRMSLNYLGYTELWRGGLVKLADSSYQEFGVIRLPPYLVGAANLSTLRLELRGKKPAGTAELALDFIQLMPLDSYRKIANIGYDIGYGAKLVDNQIDDLLYADWSGYASGYQIAYGDKIKLEPGKNQRIYFFYEAVSPGLQTSSVIISYRPRRAVI